MVYFANITLIYIYKKKYFKREFFNSYFVTNVYLVKKINKIKVN